MSAAADDKSWAAPPPRHRSKPPRTTVGSLLGAGSSEGIADNETDSTEWRITQGRVATGLPETVYTDRGVERLDYNNPYGQSVERVWFDGKVVFAIELGELEVDLDQVKVAQEYQIVYSAELDEKGKPRSEPERVEGQYNIYDSVPGMAKYSPLWQFNYVIVPRSYTPNSLQSEADCLRSGYPIVRSTVVEN